MKTARPRLPASLRVGLFDRFDRRLVGLVAGSVLVHLGVVAWAWQQEPRVDDSLAARAGRSVFEEQTVTLPDEPAPARPASEGDAGSSGTPVPPPRPEPPRAPRVSPSKPSAAPDAAAKAKADRALAQQYVSVLIGGGSGDERMRMDRKNPGAELEQELRYATQSGKTASSGGESGRGSRDDGSAKPGTGGGPEVHGPGDVDTSRTEKTDDASGTRRIAVKPVDARADDATSLTPDAVMAKIHGAYLKGIQRCYVTYLKVDPSARGKVTLSFTVNESGRATDGAARGFAGPVDACIAGLMRSWTFGKPLDEHGAPTTAGFDVALQLLPD